MDRALELIARPEKWVGDCLTQRKIYWAAGQLGVEMTALIENDGLVTAVFDKHVLDQKNI
ncbi:MAG: hypothetical protein F6K30_01145 [Cyanothece sp. SIO2G6]|nr:hypothetical protein [Cyanothece sp. SIO2G6]